MPATKQTKKYFNIAITIILILLAWSVTAWNTPTEDITIKIGDNVSSLAKGHGLSYLNLSEIDNQDAAVFLGRTGDYWWNSAAVQFYDNETNFINDAGTRSNIYFEKVDSQNDLPLLRNGDNPKHLNYLPGFFVNYWWINKTTPASIGKYQIGYIPSGANFVIKKQTNDEIEFYKDRWQALFWYSAPISPGFLLPIALIIMAISAIIRKGVAKKRKDAIV